MKLARWIFDHMIWDPAGTTLEGFWKDLWATRKLLIAIVGSLVLTWLEWEVHHPPVIAVIAVIHFLFVFMALAIMVQIGQWFRRVYRK